MKTLTGLMTTFVLGLSLGHGQGLLLPSNPTARTHLVSLDGPLAGTNVFGQILAGALPDSLIPIGVPDFHINGIIFGPEIAVPGIPAGNLAYVQMVAWDGALWGDSIANVPPDQFGRTDIVSLFLSSGYPLPTQAPNFTQSAIVPIPEPSVLALSLVAVGILLLRRRKKPCIQL